MIAARCKNLVEQRSPGGMHSGGIVVKVARVVATAINRASVKKVFTLRIFRRIG